MLPSITTHNQKVLAENDVSKYSRFGTIAKVSSLSWTFNRKVNDLDFWLKSDLLIFLINTPKYYASNFSRYGAIAKPEKFTIFDDLRIEGQEH